MTRQEKSYLFFGPCEADGTIRLPLAVCMYACMCVCDSDSQKTTHTNALFFGMKVGIHDKRKVTELDLGLKFTVLKFGHFMLKMVQK